MTISPYVMVGHISPIKKWANIMMRQISSVFWNLTLSSLAHCSLVMVITYDIQRDIFLLFQKILVKTRNEFLQMKKWPYVILGHISPNMKWANLMLRQISPLFYKFDFINTRTLFSCYGFQPGCTEGHIYPISKILVQTRKKFSK